MTSQTRDLHLPDYQTFSDAIASLDLPISGSELHGFMCGYLCAGAIKQGETYLRALITNKQSASEKRIATVALFGVYAVTQQQITNFNFDLQLLLPDEEESLLIRAQTFTEWCVGFTQALQLAGVREEQLEDEAKEAFAHLNEFAQLDYEAIRVGEEDERAFTEVSEYARMAVLHIYSNLQGKQTVDARPDRAH